MQTLIKIKDLSLSWATKVCFENFTAQIAAHSKIAIIGRNGCGKSSLLKALNNSYFEQQPTLTGTITPISPLMFGYIPQTIDNFATLSGGEKFNKTFSTILKLQPNILLLDEPSNHLDQPNRFRLQRQLNNFSGAIVIVSHDLALINTCCTTLWHLDNEKIHIFHGNYQHYLQELHTQQEVLFKKKKELTKEQAALHLNLMQNQEKIAKSKASGQKKIATRRWLKSTGAAKAMQAEQARGKQLAKLATQNHELNQQLAALALPKTITPKFSILSHQRKSTELLAITDGTIAYNPDTILLKNINLRITPTNRLAILGNNGSGKTSLIKAILANPQIITTGTWRLPNNSTIGYLDQHYKNLLPDTTVIDNIQALAPNWSKLQIRRHLSDFLFYNNVQVNAKVTTLSAGEKARLILAKIAARPPALLILDELTNNLDLETIGHTITTLQEYQGAMIVVSHELEFINALQITDFYHINPKTTTLAWKNSYELNY